MQNSRQKKRASQQKKRYHERTKERPGGAEPKADETGKSSAAEIGESKTVTVKNVVKEKPKEAESYFEFDLDNTRGDTNLVGASGHGTVKTVPHKERAAQGVEETCRQEEAHKEEEQLQQRLIQLLSLPIQHAPSPHPPSMITIGSSSDSTQDTTPTSPSSSFLTLDCASLAESLSTLALHDRLKIEHNLLELSDLPPLDEDITMDTTRQDQLLGRIDLTTCSKKKSRPHPFEFEKMAASLALNKGRGEDDQRSHHDRVPGRLVSSQLEARKTSDDDTELDRLLGKKLTIRARALEQSSAGTTGDPAVKGSMHGFSIGSGISVPRLEHPTRHADIGKPGTGTRQADIGKSGTGIESAATVIGQAATGIGMKSGIGQHNDETDELDEMLDELLS